MDIDNIIELKRALYKICTQSLADKLIENLEEFYIFLFRFNNLTFNPETIRNKQPLVQYITINLILVQLKKYVSKRQGKYSFKTKKDLNMLIFEEEVKTQAQIVLAFLNQQTNFKNKKESKKDEVDVNGFMNKILNNCNLYARQQYLSEFDNGIRQLYLKGR